ncbi:MAG: hypothetical protein PVI03_07790 [Candidatus Thorarchaeota archaeon]|jgi:hypothetical protein
MRFSRIRICAALSIFFLVGTTIAGQAVATTENQALTYWYLGESFDVNQEDQWIPFFSLTDVPHSLPLRGFISDSRNYFLDFGAVDWLSDWIEYRYDFWPVAEYEKTLMEDDLVGQLEYLYETMTARLAKPHSYVDEARNHSALDYVKRLEGAYEVFVPLVVMYDLDEVYDDSGMQEWAVHPDIIKDALNEAFPLVDWNTELFWFHYENVADFADLMEEKTANDAIWIDEDYISRCDVILHDLISTYPGYDDYDFILPTLIMLQEYTLMAALYDPPIAIGGLGRLPSIYQEVDSWCLNGRAVTSYFFAGNPDEPRAAITPTVVHELGHCVGQTDIHSEFGWFTASTSTSTMGAYQQNTVFDHLDKDLINNAQGLQLWGRYLDEISYFSGFSLNANQHADLETLEENLSTVPNLLVDCDLETLKLLFNDAESMFTQLSTELGEPRKSDGWTEYAPALDVQVDWIVGPGIPNAESVAEAIEMELETVREIVPFINTTLPTARYDVNIDVHVTDDSFNEAVLQYWGRNMVESETSMFDADEVPADAFSTWPRNRVFQTQSGYVLDGYTVERWLEDNPYTSDVTDKVHYRFYMMNLENLTPIVQEDFILDPMIIVVVGGTPVVIIAAVIVWKRRTRS